MSFPILAIFINVCASYMNCLAAKACSFVEEVFSIFDMMALVVLVSFF